jgi:hypothetical protein
MFLRSVMAVAFVSTSTLATAEPWELHFADPQDRSKIHAATFEVWDEDGDMHTRLPETFNRTQCFYVANVLSRWSKLAYPDDPDKGKYGCEPASR